MKNGKKAYLSCMIATLFLFIFTTAHAEHYASVNIGYSITDDIGDWESKNGVSVSAAAGTTIGENFRGELELSYSIYKLDFNKYYYGYYPLSEDGRIMNMAVLANGYFDWKNSSKFTPFLTAGLGFAWDAWRNGPKNNANALAWQIGAGVGYALSDKISLDLKLRHFEMAGDEHSTTNNMYFGVRYSF